jgi:hypothetical protein
LSRFDETPRDAERQVWVVSDGFAYAPPVGRAS